MPYLKKADPVSLHKCSPPKIMGEHSDWVVSSDDGNHFRSPQLREGVRLPQVGDVWACPDCYVTWVCFYRKSQYGMTYVSVGGREWRREGKFERWRRERKNR